MMIDRETAHVVHHATTCHRELRKATGDRELEAVQLAILIEDVAGVVLSDSQLDVAQLSDPRQLSALLAQQDDG